MRPTKTKAHGLSLRALTMALALALLAALLLASAALAAGGQGLGERAAKQATPTAKTPQGTITTTTPTFKWSKAAGAAKYELRVYKGSTQKLKKTGITKLSWKSTALPTNVALTWKVRASNAAGAGAWSSSLAFTITGGVPAIGHPYRGGVVAYILQAGDPGYVAGQTHGLIAATTDQVVGRSWAERPYTSTAVPGADGTAIGTGNQNTIDIVAQNGSGSTFAAGYCSNLQAGGYSDWYLPSMDELHKLHLNKWTIGLEGDFECYWSSSEYQYNAYSAWFEAFIGSGQDYDSKSLQGGVRAVRAF